LAALGGGETLTKISSRDEDTISGRKAGLAGVILLLL
jgi:hypothetical protein